MISRNREFDEDEHLDNTPEDESDQHRNWHLGTDTVSTIQGSEPQQAAERALSECDLSSGYTDARRYTSEAAARVTVGNDAVNLDKFAENHPLGHRGNNYPIYDISSTSEISSVKTHWNSECQLNDNAINTYKREFSELLGWGRNPKALEEDGANILAARDAGAPVPKELENASVTEASKYLRDNSCLRIPDDQVDILRTEIAKDIRSFPSNYYLPENPSEDQVNNVLERVKGIGCTSRDLQEMIDRRLRH